MAQVVNQRVEASLSYVGVFRQVPFPVEQRARPAPFRSTMFEIVQHRIEIGRADVGVATEVPLAIK